MLLLSFVLALLLIGFFNAPFFLWAGWALAAEFFLHAPRPIYTTTLVISVIACIPPLRRLLISNPLLNLIHKMNWVPKISESERQAIEAGKVWVEKEFFTGRPNFKTLFEQPPAKLTTEEQRFLDHQVKELCEMIDDWKIWQDREVPQPVWDYLKKEKFLGMIIPKQYGGLGFSPYGHSEVIKRLASRSFVVAIYVMVPNSLGPAELLIEYGTDEQKNEYLPKLARGEEIPCFALTEPDAGSDATNVSAQGILFKKNNELWIRLDWDKRYISLANIATLLGLAFRLKDPENLLGFGGVNSGNVDLGITCALIDAKTEGVKINTRHDPLGVPFYNSPIHGRQVEIPASQIIGGIESAGKGWGMLMECLSAGRGLSFPAQMAGASAVTNYVVSAYAAVRHQFGVSIGKFEGIQKPFSEVIGYTYLTEALRKYTLSALNQGIKPAIVASVAKYYSTEHNRKIINNAMDIIGGAGISLGPRNKIAHYYIASPLSITVEGANILTRSLMIFGQGAFRAHPYAFQEIEALEKKDLVKFDEAFWLHVGQIAKNACRSILLFLTRGWFAHPNLFSKEAKYYRKISWVSASFALFSDIAMGTLGARLKFKESITGRFSDIMGYLYLACAVIHHYHENGRKKEEWPVVEFTLDYIFEQTQVAFEGICLNLNTPYTSWMWRWVVLSCVKVNPFSWPASDRLISQVCKTALEQKSVIDRMSDGVFIPKNPEDYLVEIRAAADLFRQVDPILYKLKKSKTPLTEEEKQLLKKWKQVHDQAIHVDEFTESEYFGR